MAGTPGQTTEDLDGVAATSAAFDDPDALAIDPEGNIIVGDQGADYSLAVIAESPTQAYDISGWAEGDVYTISGGASASSTSPGPASAFELPPVYDVAYAKGDLYVTGYNATIGTPAAIYQVTGAPVPGSITQLAPTSGSVDAGTAYSGQLAVSGEAGTVTYVTTTTSPQVAVSSSGAITGLATTPVGGYTVSGTDSDPLGNSGTWTFTLHVVGVTLTQAPPTSATVQFGSTLTPTQLSFSNAQGAVTFTTTSSNANLSVSSSGVVSEVGSPGDGSYTVSGTGTDSLGDTGSWTFTLTVTGPSLVLDPNELEHCGGVQAVEIEVSGFGPDKTVDIRLSTTTGRLLKTLTTNSSGSGSTSDNVNTSTVAVGSYKIVAVQAGSGTQPEATTTFTMKACP